jgi:hypothetical protein
MKHLTCWSVGVIQAAAGAAGAFGGRISNKRTRTRDLHETAQGGRGETHLVRPRVATSKAKGKQAQPAQPQNKKATAHA